MKKLYSAIICLCMLAAGTRMCIAQWVQTAGPKGINVNTFYDNGTWLFAATYAKGVWRSADHGITWSAANAGIENALCYSFAEDSDYLYVGMSGGVYRSDDDGVTWTAANNGILTQSVSELYCAGGYVFAGTIGFGVFRSGNQGGSWVNTNLGNTYIMAMCYSGNKLIVEGDNYIWWTDDFGVTWNLDQGNTAFYPIDNFITKGDTVLASAYGGVFHSYDGGNNWSSYMNINPDFYLKGFALVNDTLYAGCQYGVYRSADWGNSWTYIPCAGLRFGTRFHNHFYKSGSYFLFGMDELGVFLSEDMGATWTQTITGLPPASSIDNSIINIGDDILTGTHSDGIYKTTDNGVTWDKTGTPSILDTLSNAIVFAMLNPAPNIILAGTCGYKCGLFRSADNGVTWSHITSGLPIDPTGFSCAKSLAKVGSNLVVGTTDGIYYSTDLGLHWSSSNIGGGNNFLTEGIAANGNVACAGLSNGNTIYPTGMYRSTNGGVTWSLVVSILDILCIASDGNSSFYCGTFSDNWRSTNNGQAWTGVGGGIPGGAGGFAIKAIGNNVFIGNSEGIYYSPNQGGSFTNATTGMDPYPNNAVQGIAANSQYLYAGMFVDAIWRRPLSDFGITGVAEQNNFNHEELILYPNTPNPFITQTTINYSLPENGKVSLTITDAVGRMVYQYTNTESAGDHSLIVKGEDFTSGIYLARLSCNGETRVLKLNRLRTP